MLSRPAESTRGPAGALLRAKAAEVDEAMRTAGVLPGEPIEPIVRAMMAHGQAVGEAVDTLARKLDDVTAKLDRMPRRVGFAPASPRFDRMLAMAVVISSLSLIVVGAGLFSGRLHRSGVAPEWRRVAELNDYAATPKNCAQQNGRMACAMTVYVGE